MSGPTVTLTRWNVEVEKVVRLFKIGRSQKSFTAELPGLSDAQDLFDAWVLGSGVDGLVLYSGFDPTSRALKYNKDWD